MPTLNQIASGLAIQAGKPFDIPFQEYMKFIVKNWTLTLTKRSLEDKPLDRRFFQTSFVMQVATTSAINCPITYGCRIRTVAQVPTPLMVNNILFDFVGNADFTISYGQMQEWQLQYKKYNRYTKHDIDYIYKDGYIFLDGNKLDNDIKYIGIQGIFSDYSQVNSFKCLTTCPSDDDEFPIRPDLLENVLQSIYANELKAYFPSTDGTVQSDANTKEVQNNGNR